MDRILSLEGLRKLAVKPVFLLALGLGCGLAAAPGLCAQAAAGGQAAGSGQSKPAAAQSQPASAPKSSAAQPQSSANPFPADLSTVPIIPTRNSPETPAASGNGSGNGGFTLPDYDPDPVPSPDDSTPSAANGQGQGFSSSLSGLGPLLPNAQGNLPGSGNRQNQNSAIAPFPQSSPKQDISVGNFYLDTGDWKGAFSRFESALVLDPDNPDVYWGLAESERHLGQYAAARENYLKVMEYDPGSHHAKEARKALRDPQIANARPAARGQAAAETPK